MIPAEVLALGNEARTAAERYAGLTGRAYGGCLDAYGQINLSTCAVVLTTTAFVTAELLEFLSSADGDALHTPGLIFSTDADSLVSTAIGIAARLHQQEAAAKVVEVFGHLPVEGEATDDVVPAGGVARAIFGSAASASEIRSNVTSPADAITFVTHSNGYDMYLGGGLSFCDCVESRGRSAVGAPCCEFNDICFRQGMRRAEARNKGLIITPDEIRARIIVMYTCSAILGTREAREWGYMSALLAAGNAAAVVAGWSFLVPDGQDLTVLLNTLYAGGTVGRAVASVNRRDPTARLAVLGDPEARLPDLTRAAELTPPAFPQQAPHVSESDGRFLRTLMGEIAQDGPEDVRDLARIAHTQLLGYERDCALGRTPAPADALSARLTSLMALGRLGPLVAHHWLPLSYSQNRIESLKCSSCSARSERLSCRFRSSGLEDRELYLCPRCGIRRDARFGQNVELLLVDNVLSIEGRLPDENWSALLYMGSQARELSPCISWPPDEAGRPVRRFRPPHPWPSGPVTMTLFLIENAELTMITAFSPSRADKNVANAPDE